MATGSAAAVRKRTRGRLGIATNSIRRHYELYLFLLPTLLYFIIFHYGPLYGAQIAFRDFMGSLGIWKSPWVGFAQFERFFKSAFFWQLLRNTLALSLYGLIFGFPIPVIFALLLNQVRHTSYRKLVQTISYAPHFISTVVFVGIIFIFLSPSTGIVNLAIRGIGGQSIYFMGSSAWFRPVYVISDIWKETGWSAIIYLATLASVSPELYEAAKIDGASKFQRIVHIDVPSILPTVTIMLILRVGAIMSIGFEKSFLMQTALNLDRSEIISTYVYKVGLLGAQFSFGSAVGLFNSVINLILIAVVNRVARVIGETSLW